MFQVHIKLAFLIEGCPSCGLEAVDFRGDNHIERDAHNLFLVRYRNLEHEALCRTYAEFLNADADLIIRMVGGLEEILIPSALNGLIHPETGSVMFPVLSVAAIRDYQRDKLRYFPEMMGVLKDFAGHHTLKTQRS